MITVWISEIRFGNNWVIRKAQVTEEQIWKVVTHIYSKGGAEVDKELLKTHRYYEENIEIKEEDKHFMVPAPLLLPLVKELENLIQVKFVEVKIRRNN